MSALARRFGASPAARSRVIDYLRQAGATGIKIDATGLFADATMSAGTAQRLFGTSLARFHSGRAGAFVAPAGAPRIPAALSDAVAGVVGLDTRPVFGPSQSVAASARFAHEAPVAAPNTGATQDQASAANVVSGYSGRTGTPAGCAAGVAGGGFTPNQYLTAYGFSPLQSAGIQGQGERVALIEIDGFRYSDLRTFAKCFGLGVPAINGYGVGIGKPLAPGGESTLDLEVLDAAAPKLKEIDVYESRSTASDVLRSLTAPLQNHGKTPQVISASLGTCEPALVESIGYSGVRAVEGALAAAAASGISVLASSGDDGSTACIGRTGPIDLLSVSFPASSPLVTGVGGTNVILNPDNTLASQMVWNDGPDDLAAGGGGVSGLFTRPSYQKGFVAPDRRVVPDVALLADVLPGYAIYCSVRSDCMDPTHPGSWVAVGGTSASAPLMAGGLALTDQVLRQRGRAELGLANLLLYPIAHSASAASVFSDVIANDNDLSPYIGDHRPLGCCSAGPGFDYATGLGSVNISAFANLASVLRPAIPLVGVSLPNQRPVAKQRLLATVSCSGKCVALSVASIAIDGSRPFQVRSGTVVLRQAGRRTVKLKLSDRDLGRIRDGLHAHRKVIATVFGVLTDSGGNVERTSAARTLRIR
jgi:kumamolisin